MVVGKVLLRQRRAIATCGDRFKARRVVLARARVVSFFFSPATVGSTPASCSRGTPALSPSSLRLSP